MLGKQKQKTYPTKNKKLRLFCAKRKVGGQSKPGADKRYILLFKECIYLPGFFF